MRHKILAIAFLVACVLSLFFSVKIIYDIFDHQPNQNEPISGWMTVGYIAKSRGLDPYEIDKRAGLPLPIAGQPQTLNQTAKARNVPVEQLISDLERVVTEMKSEAAQ